jgi:hypothetical protein
LLVAETAVRGFEAVGQFEQPGEALGRDLRAKMASMQPDRSGSALEKVATILAS